MKGNAAGVQEPHPDRGPALALVLKRLAAGLVSPTNALIELNDSPFMVSHSLYKMDKFRKIVTDPYYAGVVMIDKHIKYRNENGRHAPLITLKEHYRLLEIMDNKPKYQTGPKRQGNPMFPLSNLVEDDSCLDLKDKGRLVGVPHTNGKTSKVYKKYRCRSCKHFWNLDNMHDGIADFFKEYEMPADTQEKVLDALDIVWQKDSEQRVQNIASTRRSIIDLRAAIKQRVISATDPSNASIKDEIIAVIEDEKARVIKLEIELERLTGAEDEDKREFMEFALGFIQHTGQHFLDPHISKENRLRCKQMLFPGGIMIRDKEKVYTPEISPISNLAANKKVPALTSGALLVQHS